MNENETDKMNRRTFMQTGALAGAAALAGCQTGGVSKPAPKDDLIVADLIHLGFNISCFVDMPLGSWPVVPSNIKDPVIAKNLKDNAGCRDYLRFDEPTWHEVSEHFRKRGVNMVVIDVLEGLIYPSHPELAVKGSWTPEKLRTELDRLRKMGLEPIPKLNFSTSHNGWMRDWRHMVSSQPYYQFCDDLIRDVCDIFDHPRFFHLGCDEERIPSQKSKLPYILVRQGDQWFGDLNRLVKSVEKCGARAWMWSDAFWKHSEEFVKKVPKTVLQSNWYYRCFSDEALKARGKDWYEGSIMRRDAYAKLDKAGYDQVLCSSNFYDWPRTMEDTAVYARANMTPSLVKGFMMASWYRMDPVLKQRICTGADQLAEAVRIWKAGA